MMVWGEGDTPALRESYPQWYPPHSSSLELPAYWLRRSRTWWWTGHPLSWGVWGGDNGRPPPFTRPADFSEVGSYRDFSTRTPLVVVYVGGGVRQCLQQYTWSISFLFWLTPSSTLTGHLHPTSITNFSTAQIFFFTQKIFFSTQRSTEAGLERLFGEDQS